VTIGEILDKRRENVPVLDAKLANYGDFDREKFLFKKDQEKLGIINQGNIYA